MMKMMLHSLIFHSLPHLSTIHRNEMRKEISHYLVFIFYAARREEHNITHLTDENPFTVSSHKKYIFFYNNIQTESLFFIMVK